MCLLILLNAAILGNCVFSLCLQAASIIALSKNFKTATVVSALSFLLRTSEIQGVFSSFPAYPGGAEIPKQIETSQVAKTMGRSF